MECHDGNSYHIRNVMNDIYQNTSSILMDILNMYIRMEYQEYHVSRHIYVYHLVI
jgi:hypothetical protein